MALWLGSLVAVRGTEPPCHPTGGLGLCTHIPGRCTLGTPGGICPWLRLHKCYDFVPGKFNSSSLELPKVASVRPCLWGTPAPMCSLFHGSVASLLLCEKPRAVSMGSAGRFAPAATPRLWQGGHLGGVTPPAF